MKIKEISDFFDNVYQRPHKDYLHCLYYPVIDALSQKNEWMKREDVIKSISEKYHLTSDNWARNALSFDHLVSHRFGKGDEANFLNELIEHDGVKPGDHKKKYKLKNFQLVKNFLNSPLDHDVVLSQIKARLKFAKEKNTSDQTSTITAKTQKSEQNDNNPALSKPYGIKNILNEGCFLEETEIENVLQRLQDKKNLILQGPPGTGKTWLAKRLAYALMGEKITDQLRVVQFHPNLSYEDFVRGLRPNINGKLESTDGVFLKAIGDAQANLDAKFVVVIEEINRGNPAQIFGELLTLLENSKREVAEAIQLCYPDKEGNHDPVHIPENLYVIGTMNIADRSLALVDLALRRRFSFVTLEPKFGPVWREWVIKKCNLDPDLVDELANRMESLNQSISSSLGEQFRVGHSYVTPHNPLEEGDTKNWFRQVVETEIEPLLEEYWFDSVGKAKEATKQLLKDW